MERMKGKIIVPGVASGIMKYCGTKTQTVSRHTVEDTNAEEMRFYAARQQADIQLASLSEVADTMRMKDGSDVIEAQRVLLNDPELSSTIVSMIHSEIVNAEYAVACAGIYYYDVMSKLDDAKLSERSTDISEVTELLLNLLIEQSLYEETFLSENPVWLSDKSENTMEGADGDFSSEDALLKTEVNGSGNTLLEKKLEENGKYILAAKELTAAQMLRFPKEKIAGFITGKGGMTSHFAIMAASMGLPALTGIVLQEDCDGQKAIINAEEGELYVNPDFEMESSGNHEMIHVPDNPVIWKNKEIMLMANISDVSELAHVQRYHADGIGLFRTEFLFMKASYWPTEEEQFVVYKQVLQSMNPKPVTIRTMDIGTDKQVAYFGLEKEDNPALGFRGIRYCLQRKELFKLQLKALYRAAVYGPLSVLYPMVTTMKEVDEILTLKDEVIQELEEDGYTYDSHVKTGIMIETPAAALISEKLAGKVDFFSIGTNDLTQFTLACDRQNEILDTLVADGKEIIMELVKSVIQNAKRVGIPVCICGDMAGNAVDARCLIEYGADALSMIPFRIPSVRKRMSSKNYKLTD